MLFSSLILPGILVPSVAAALALLVGRALGQRRSALATGSLAAAAAFLAAFVALTSWPRFPPTDSTQRLFYLVLLAALFALSATLRGHDRIAWWLRSALLSALLVLLLKTPLQHTWNGGQAVAWLVGLFALGWGLGWALETAFRRASEGRDLLASAVRLSLLGGIAPCLGLSASARLGQLAGAVACGALIVELAAWLRRTRPWRPADATVLATAILGLLIIGHFYAELTAATALLLVVAYGALALPGAHAGWRRFLPLVPLAAALGLTIVAAMNKADDPYDDYGSNVAELSSISLS